MILSIAVASAGLLLAGAFWARRPRRRRQVRNRAPRPRVDLADLKAESERRLQSMRDCRLTVLEGRREGGWLCLVVRVEPPTPETRWWPWGVSVECPLELARRDAASQGPPLQGALPRRLEGHRLDAWLHGRAEVVLRVQPPADCTCLEIGYYGRPATRYEFSGAAADHS